MTPAAKLQVDEIGYWSEVISARVVEILKQKGAPPHAQEAGAKESDSLPDQEMA
jgi:hypothetical protein